MGCAGFVVVVGETAGFSETAYMSCSLHGATSQAEFIHICVFTGMGTSTLTDRAPLHFTFYGLGLFGTISWEA
jgi:hypothetical protein